MLSAPSNTRNRRPSKAVRCYMGVMIHCVMLNYIILRYVMLCYVMLCYVMSCHVMLCYVMLCCVMLCYIMLCYVMLCYVMLCYVTILSASSNTRNRRPSKAVRCSLPYVTRVLQGCNKNITSELLEVPRGCYKRVTSRPSKAMQCALPYITRSCYVMLWYVMLFYIRNGRPSRAVRCSLPYITKVMCYVTLSYSMLCQESDAEKGREVLITLFQRFCRMLQAFHADRAKEGVLQTAQSGKHSCVLNHFP
jgi:hypothetical protein